MSKNVIVLSLGVLITLVVGAVLLASTVKNKPCLTKPAGDTSGGEMCANKACYDADVGHVYLLHKGAAYTKCGTTEYAYDCDKKEQVPICMRRYTFINRNDCLAEVNSISVDNTFSGFASCTSD